VRPRRARTRSRSAATRDDPPNAGLSGECGGQTIDVMAVSTAELRRGRDDLVLQVGSGTTAAEVFSRASSRLRRIVPFDAAAWLGTDPGTGLPTSPVRIDDLDGITQRMCAEHWHHELLVDDVNLFRQLIRAEQPAASLHASVDDLTHSGRYRRFLRPLGFHDELRAVLRVGDAPWGTITLWREEGHPPFTARETALVAGLSAPIGEALRRHARPSDELGGAADHDRPGLLLFDAEGETVSVNEDARLWLAELPVEPGVPTDHGVDVPVWMLITMFRASAVRHGAGDGTARTRVRTRRGRWLVCHASCLRRTDGTIGDTAVVIEPAQPGAIAPIVVEAYDLSDREQQIVQLIARGAGTAEIADELLLSHHTVRDHIKAVFAKAEVSSRGELVAKLFAEFYEPVHRADVTRAHADPDATPVA
jgi:DNA-binding CsgD family transcriptional regulator